MKRRKLLAKLNSFLAQPDDRAATQRAAMKKVLSALKQKERKLREKIRHEDDVERRQQLAQELAICRAQRKKGVERLRELHSRR